MAKSSPDAPDIQEEVNTLVATVMSSMERRRRSFPSYSAKFVGKYAKLVGEVTWASNDLHSVLAILFSVLIDREDVCLGRDIWNSIKADSVQREMLLAAAKWKLRKKKRLLSQIIWLVNSAGKISRSRNDAVHTHMLSVVTSSRKVRIDPSHLVPEARAERLAGEQYKRLYPLLRGDLLELTDYASALSWRLMYDGPYAPLPRRPKLRSQELLHASKASKHQKGSRRGVRAFRA